MSPPSQRWPNVSPQSELARCLDDNELPEFLDVLGAAQEVGYNLDEHYGKEVGRGKSQKNCFLFPVTVRIGIGICDKIFRYILMSLNFKVVKN